MKCSWSCVKSGSENQDPQVFPASIWEQGHIFVFSTFWISESPIILKQILAKEWTIKQMCQVSLKYMEPNGRGNVLKIASFLSYLQNFAF